MIIGLGRLRIPTNSLASTYFTYQTSPALNTKHHLRLVSNDYIELQEGATIGGLDAGSRISIFTLDPGSFCSTFEPCGWCTQLSNRLPFSLEIKLTLGVQIGVKFGEVFEADLTAVNVEVVKDVLFSKDNQLNSFKQIGPYKVTPVGKVENNGSVVVENSIGIKGAGLGAKIGQRQKIDGELRSSSYKQYIEKGAEFAGLSGKIVKETDRNGNTTISRQEGFSLGAKFILGIELDFQIGR